MSMITWECKVCGAAAYGDDEIRAVFDVSRKYTSAKRYTNRSLVCGLCKTTARTKAKEENRFITKAKNTINHHAKKFAEPKDKRPAWLSSPSGAELTDRFLWTINQIAHDMEHAWQNGCDDCHAKFQGMPNGLHDLTVDIIDPLKPPYWGLNTRFLCTTCNRAKSKTPPELHGARKAYAVRWQKRQEWLKLQPKWQQSGFWDGQP